MSEFLSDVEARAQRRRTQVRADQWRELVRLSWRRGKEASDPAEARRWLERAHRMAPRDGAVALSLAGCLLQLGAWAEAAGVFREVAERDGAPEAWVGLGTCAHLLGDGAAARAAVATALRGRVPDEALAMLAGAVAPAWCSLTVGGVVQASVPIAQVRLDGVALRMRRGARRVALPPGWRDGGAVEVEGAGGAMLGSPLPVRAFAAVEGFAEAVAGGVEGWAWHPADPALDPTVVVQGPLGRCDLVLTEAAEGVEVGRPLARPRRLVLDAAAVAALGEPVAVLGADGRHVLGSPLEPGLEARAAAGIEAERFAPVWADVVGPAPMEGGEGPPVDVVIPVHGGRAATMACLGSVLASVSAPSRVIVVDDASPDPVLRAELDRLAKRRRIVLVHLAVNRGFPGAVNAGLAAAAGRDVVLLNSDTLVPPGWLGRLRAAAYRAPGIGTVTPLTNDGTILSYPDPAGGNPMPDLAGTVALDGLAQAANAGQGAEIPVGVGFCLYVRRAALAAAGPLREDLFAQGYGEENDFCLRARHCGFRHVAAADVFVAHAGAGSFRGGRAHLVRRNGAILERLHPGYGALVAAHEAADPLRAARRRLDTLRWAAGRRRAGAVVLVTHRGGGGVERVVGARAAATVVGGMRAVVLRPVTGGLVVEEPGGEAVPNLRFEMPGEMEALVRLLRADRPKRVELHHLLGHHHEVAGLAARLGAEAVSVVHDYARFCPRIALVSTERRYCGEPDLTGCEACIADLGSLLEDDPPVRELVARSGAELRGAARVVVPSVDVATRMGRHFPGIASVVEAPEDDGRAVALAPAPREGALRVVVVGAIGVEKGFEVLLGCARDARARALPIEFVVVGFTMDDERLLAAGPVFITGEYAEAEAEALIRAQRGQMAFIPSVWPETWCFALSVAWSAGLPAAVFDLGAPAERVRRSGRGWVLPLGLLPRAVNDALLRLAPVAPASQCPPPLSRPESERDSTCPTTIRRRHKARSPN